MYAAGPPGEGFNYQPQEYGTISNHVTMQLVDENSFNTRTPKADSIIAVKLTANNLKAVAAQVIKSLDKGRVEVADDLFIDGVVYLAGEWLVKEWNYSLSRVQYRVATLVERQKYDLR